MNLGLSISYFGVPFNEAILLHSNRVQKLLGKILKSISKWIFHALLLGVGIIIFGAYNIIYADNLALQELGPFYSNEYDTPNIINYPQGLNQTQLHGNSVNYILTNYRTNDVFAVNNPITASIEINVKNVTEIEKVILVEKSYLTTQSSFINGEKSIILRPIPVAEGMGLQLVNPNNSNSFFGNWTFTPPLQQYSPPAVLVYLKNNHLESYLIDSTAPPLHPFTEKLQVDANRISVHQTFGQAKSNHVIEGISWIIVAWIPLELWVRKITEKVKEHREINKIRSLLKSDFSMIDRIYKTYLTEFERLQAKIVDGTLAPIHTIEMTNLQLLMDKTEMKFDFKFWNALVSSGSLIKLEPLEIKIIQIVHDEIMSGYEREYEAWKTMANKLAIIVQDPLAGQAAKEGAFNQVAGKFLQDCITYFNNVKQLLSYTKEIGWFDLDSEYKIEIPMSIAQIRSV